MLIKPLYFLINTIRYTLSKDISCFSDIFGPLSLINTKDEIQELAFQFLQSFRNHSHLLLLLFVSFFFRLTKITLLTFLYYLADTRIFLTLINNQGVFLGVIHNQWHFYATHYWNLHGFLYQCILSPFECFCSLMLFLKIFDLGKLLLSHLSIFSQIYFLL